MAPAGSLGYLIPSFIYLRKGTRQGAHAREGESSLRALSLERVHVCKSASAMEETRGIEETAKISEGL